MVDTLNYDTFHILCFKNSFHQNGDEFFFKMSSVTDIFKSKSKESFIEQIRSVTSKRLVYLNYWKENINKDIVAVYDEISDKRLAIEEAIKDLEYDCFVLRRNSIDLSES